MIDLKNKLILITGSTSGIGQACAYAFAQSGAKIALTGRNENRLSALAKELNDSGTDCFFYNCDLTDHESVISLKAETHNFPTTVEPFNGAATGSGGEIRDRLAGGCLLYTSDAADE